MKKLFIIFLIVTSSIASKAQTSFSCYYRDFCLWNETSEQFDICTGYAENSLFVVNNDETMFTHTTDILKSTYYVTEREYDEDKEIWIFTVVSDVGNKYLFIFDPKNKQIRTLFVYESGDPVLIVFSVKSIF